MRKKDSSSLRLTFLRYSGVNAKYKSVFFQTMLSSYGSRIENPSHKPFLWTLKLTTRPGSSSSKEYPSVRFYKTLFGTLRKYFFTRYCLGHEGNMTKNALKLSTNTIVRDV